MEVYWMCINTIVRNLPDLCAVTRCSDRNSCYIRRISDECRRRIDISIEDCGLVHSVREWYFYPQKATHTSPDIFEFLGNCLRSIHKGQSCANLVTYSRGRSS